MYLLMNRKIRGKSAEERAAILCRYRKMWHILLLGVLQCAIQFTVANAQNICVRDGGQEACIVHTVDPLAGTHVWTLWTDNFLQRIELDSLGTDSLSYQLVAFERIAEDDTLEWSSGAPFSEEYELQYGWSSSSFDSLLLQGPTGSDSLEFVETNLGKSEQDSIEYVWYSVRFKHKSQPLELGLFYRAYVDGYLECWARVTNTSASEDTTLFLNHLTSFRRTLSPDGWEKETDSRWAVEYVEQAVIAKYHSVDSVEVTLNLNSWGTQPGLGSLGWCAARYDTLSGGSWNRAEGFITGLIQASGAQAWPYLLVMDRDGRELDLKIWNLERTQSDDHDEGETRATILPQVIPAGMSAEGSHVYFMFTDGSIDDASSRTHCFMRNHYVPDAPTEPDSMPRIQFLTHFWDKWSINYESIIEQAEVCEDLGVELFVIDANWWPYSLFNGGPSAAGFACFRRGNGYWVSDACRFPEPDSTLAHLVDALEQRSMDTGIWVFPAGVDTTLFRVEDELECWGENPPTGTPCFYSASDSLSCTPWQEAWYSEFGSGDFWGKCNPDTSHCPYFINELASYLGELCCAHDSARTWMRAQLGRLLDDSRYGFKYLRFDGSIHPCVSRDHTHRMPLSPNDTLSMRVQTTLQGYYELLEEVREDYAGVIFESSWPLGHVATSEDVDPSGIWPSLSRYSMESLRCFMLPQYTGCFLLHEPDTTKLTTEAEKEAIREHYVRTAMLGPFAISCDLTEWSGPYQEVVSDAIEYYKESRRFIRGDAYNVLTQRCFCPQEPAGCDTSWDAVQFCDPDSGDARVFVFRTEPPDSDTLRSIVLQGLEASTDYVIRSVDLDAVMDTLLGDSLMTSGIGVLLNLDNSSEILEVYPTE